MFVCTHEESHSTRQVLCCFCPVVCIEYWWTNISFKICHNLYDPLTTKTLFEFVPNDNPTRGHNFKIKKIRTNSKDFNLFFTNRIVNDWNNLPSKTVNSNSINSFKNSIDNLYKDIAFSTHIKNV